MQPLLLLHGALGSREQFDAFIPKLKDHYELHTLDFEGHGDAGPTDSSFRIEYFAENILGYLDEHGLEQINIFGYSMGGYVALTLARDYPDRLNKIATLGTILKWDREVARRECRFLYPEKIKEKVPHFGERLRSRHGYRWEKVVNQTREMLEDMGTEPPIKSKDWEYLDTPIRIHIGDRDTTAGINETIEVYRKIPKASLCVLPASDHPISEIKQHILLSSLFDFF